MSVADAQGRRKSLRLPTECLNELVMTLPEMARQALRRLYRDDSLRLVYTAATVRIEIASDGATLILTLQTPDGFAVSFGLTHEQLQIIRSVAAGACGAGTERRGLIN